MAIGRTNGGIVDGTTSQKGIVQLYDGVDSSSTTLAATAAAAKAAYDKSVRFYKSVAELGLTVGSATLNGAVSAMLSNTVFMGENANFASSELPFPEWHGIIRIQKTNGWLISAEAYGHDLNYYGDYRMCQSGANTMTGTWVRTTYVRTGTFAQNTNYTTNANTNMIVKQIGNVVSVYGDIYPTYEIPAWATIGTVTPAPIAPQMALIFPNSGSVGYDVCPALLYVDGHLDTFYRSVKPNIRWYIQLTYFL